MEIEKWADPPPSSGISTRPSRSGERVLFEQEDVLVTPTRFVVGTATYPIAGITTVQLRTDSQRSTFLGGATFLAGVLAALGLACVLSSAAAFGVVFALGCVLALCVWACTPLAWVVTLRTAGGDVKALHAREAFARDVLAAINEAIVCRG